MSEISAEGAQPVSAEIRDTLLEPFITATRAALSEMAGADMVIRAVCRCGVHHALGDVSVVLTLASTTEDALVLSFPERTAEALARRILAGVSVEVDDQLIRDCVGEIGNVVAGRAKALLAGTSYHFSFSPPRVLVGVNDFQVAPGLDCLVVAFNGDAGEFTLQLFVKL